MQRLYHVHIQPRRPSEMGGAAACLYCAQTGMCGPIDRAPVPAEFGMQAILLYSLCGAGPRLDRLMATRRADLSDHSRLRCFHS